MLRERFASLELKSAQEGSVTDAACLLRLLVKLLTTERSDPPISGTLPA
jgi:hypothetical protein